MRRGISARAPLCARIVQIVAPLASRKSRLEAYFRGVLSGQTTSANLLLVLATFCQCLTSDPLKGCFAVVDAHRVLPPFFLTSPLASVSLFPFLAPSFSLLNEIELPDRCVYARPLYPLINPLRNGRDQRDHESGCRPRQRVVSTL